MRATLSRDGRNVGVFTMTRDGAYEWDCLDYERERFEPFIETIIEEVGEPNASVGRGELRSVAYKPGDPRWFDRVLARLQNKGYEHVVVDDGR